MLDTDTVDESPEDKLAGLMLRGCSNDGNGKRGYDKSMPPHRVVIRTLVNA